MRWIPYAMVCALFLASADFFVKLASSRISSSLGAMVYGLTTLTAGLAWVLYERATGQPQFSTPQGWGYAFLVGLAFSGVTILLYVTLTRVEVSVGSPTIRLLRWVRFRQARPMCVPLARPGGRSASGACCGMRDLLRCRRYLWCNG